MDLLGLTILVVLVIVLVGLVIWFSTKGPPPP
jgi:hypothetical protein